MLIISLLLIPLVGVLLVSTKTYHHPSKDYSYHNLVFKTNHDRYTKLVNDLTSAYIPDLSSHNGVTSPYIPDLSSDYTDQ
jgi:hypothetical protein